MFSFCIPIYNYDVRKLVTDIHSQASKELVDFEIVLIDDCSEIRFKEFNRELSELHSVVYDELSSNIGRSRIRNLLAKRAKHQYLVFIDCDSMCPDKLYVQRYAKLAVGKVIVHGGTIYHSKPSSQNAILHWTYGSKREVVPLKQRLRKPYHSFTTNNFMISSNLFSEFGFNEQLTGYGHEDTLFGYELMLSNIPIHHTDNPLLHEGLDTAEAFLRKTRQGILNLIHINKLMLGDKDLANLIKLLRVFNLIKKFGMVGVVRFLFSICEKALEKNLQGKSPKLACFDFYKLGYFCANNDRARDIG